MSKLSPIAVALVALLGCDPVPCGPSSAVVERVVDGDTIELEDGTRVRYLLVNTPENTTSQECYGPEATAFNRMLVQGQKVKLRYDAVCNDKYGRLLAYVSVGDVDVNASLVQNGYACVLRIPPNGEAEIDEYREFENEAQSSRAGLWGSCEEEIPCGD